MNTLTISGYVISLFVLSIQVLSGIFKGYIKEPILLALPLTVVNEIVFLVYPIPIFYDLVYSLVILFLAGTLLAKLMPLIYAVLLTAAMMLLQTGIYAYAPTYPQWYAGYNINPLLLCSISAFDLIRIRIVFFMPKERMVALLFLFAACALQLCTYAIYLIEHDTVMLQHLAMLMQLAYTFLYIILSALFFHLFRQHQQRYA